MDVFNSIGVDTCYDAISTDTCHTETESENIKHRPIPAERLSLLDRLFESYSVVAEGADVFLCDMRYDYSRWSKRAVDFFNLPSEYMYNAGTIWETHIHPDDCAVYHKSIDELFSGAANGHDMQYRATDGSGRYYMCTCRGIVLFDNDGTPEYFGGAIRNQTINDGIDRLTGLSNQMSFFRDINLYIQKKIPVNIVMYGPTHFSRINDLYGYDFGNMLLQHISRYLFEDCRNVGTVYRLDGMRVALVTKSMNMDQLRERYNYYRKVLSEGYSFAGKIVDVPINAGALRLDRFDIDIDTLFSCLTQAYSESKNDLQGGFCIFNSDASPEKKYKIELINKIRRSVAEGCHHFQLYYQPVVFTDTETIKGAEALVRWVDDDGTVVGPNAFIPVLENDALFPALGEWILRQAMTDGVKFIKKYPDFVLNVNLSYAQIQDQQFIPRIEKALADTGFPTRNLCLEITERCRLVDMNRLIIINDQLMQEGIQFALDDFGTGFSSLGILKNLTFRTLKIDRQFVIDIDTSEKQRRLVKNLAELARIHNCRTCAEGVETKKVADVLRTCDVDTLQGYYYSKPIPADAFFDKYCR